MAEAADDSFDQQAEDNEGDHDYEGDAADFGGFPLLFFGVEGRDVSDDDSPSFYNPTEAMVVRSLITKLLGMQHLGVTTDQIGVIAPYRKQVPMMLARVYACVRVYMCIQTYLISVSRWTERWRRMFVVRETFA